MAPLVVTSSECSCARVLCWAWPASPLAIPLAYLAARAMTSLLFGVEPGDPFIYAAASLALLMTVAGSLRTALRAASIDPAITIRTE